ncbi:hypothetical protein [Streptomyces albus]|uniref:hypothetical protein n=1 Tax=Streptomyces albus TaxID=1888 RepID=UPI0034547E12
MGPAQLPSPLHNFGSRPGVAGAVIAGSAVTGTFGTPAFPQLRRRPTTTAITTVSITLLGAGRLPGGTGGMVVRVLGGMLAGGTGAGLVAPDLNLLLSELAPDGRHGRVLSGLVTAVFLGQFLSPPALQRLVRGTGLAVAFTWTRGAPAAGAVRPWPVSPPA